MHESRCGVRCGECKRRDDVDCKGCTEMEKPFWGGGCEVKSCCETKGLNHCGLCEVFPCSIISTMGVEHGYDPEPRLVQCRKWAAE